MYKRRYIVHRFILIFLISTFLFLISCEPWVTIEPSVESPTSAQHIKSENDIDIVLRDKHPYFFDFPDSISMCWGDVLGDKVYADMTDLNSQFTDDCVLSLRAYCLIDNIAIYFERLDSAPIEMQNSIDILTEFIPKQILTDYRFVEPPYKLIDIEHDKVHHFIELSFPDYHVVTSDRWGESEHDFSTIVLYLETENEILNHGSLMTQVPNWAWRYELNGLKKEEWKIVFNGESKR